MKLPLCKYLLLSPKVELTAVSISKGGCYFNDITNDWFLPYEETNQLQDR